MDATACQDIRERRQGCRRIISRCHANIGDLLVFQYQVALHSLTIAVTLLNPVKATYCVIAGRSIYETKSIVQGLTRGAPFKPFPSSHQTQRLSSFVPEAYHSYFGSITGVAIGRVKETQFWSSVILRNLCHHVLCVTLAGSEAQFSAD